LWERGCDFATDAGGELAAFAVRRDADLEGAVGVCGEEGECAEVRRVDYIDRDSVSLADTGDQDAY